MLARIFITILFFSKLCEAKESVIRVSPNSTHETFSIGVTTQREADSILFEFNISTNTTKPTWPFDCSLSTGVGKLEWEIDSPCYDSKTKKAATETIRLTIPFSQISSAVFEFSYYLKVVDITETWRVELKDYSDDSKAE